MSSHVYDEIYIHFNWHTKGDRPLLSGDLEALTHTALEEKCRRIKGAYLHGVLNFGRRNFDWMLDSVRRQREHHASGQVQARLEACDVTADAQSSPAEAGYRKEKRK